MSLEHRARPHTSLRAAFTLAAGDTLELTLPLTTEHLEPA